MNQKTKIFLKKAGAPSNRLNGNPENWIWLATYWKWPNTREAHEARALLRTDLERVLGREAKPSGRV